MFLVRLKKEGHRVGEKQRRAKNGDNYPGQGVGRIQKFWPEKGTGTARPRRAGVEMVVGRVLVSRQGFGTEIGGKRYGARFTFLVKLLDWDGV